MNGMCGIDWSEIKDSIHNAPKTKHRIIEEELAHIAWEMYHKLDNKERDELFGPQIDTDGGYEQNTDAKTKTKTRTSVNDGWSDYWSLSDQQKQAIFV